MQRTFTLGLGPDQESMNAVILMNRFNIPFYAGDASRPENGVYMQGVWGKVKPPFVHERVKVPELIKPVINIYIGEQEIRNFIRTHALGDTAYYPPREVPEDKDLPERRQDIVLPVTAQSKYPSPHWSKVRVWCVGSVDCIRRERTPNGVFISSEPPAVLMPDETDAILQAKREIYVFEDSPEYFDAYTVFRDRVYRVLATK